MTLSARLSLVFVAANVMVLGVLFGPVSLIGLSMGVGVLLLAVAGFAPQNPQGVVTITKITDHHGPDVPRCRECGDANTKDLAAFPITTYGDPTTHHIYVCARCLTRGEGAGPRIAGT